MGSSLTRRCVCCGILLERAPITFLSSQRWLLFVQGLSQEQAWSIRGRMLWIDGGLLSFGTGNRPLMDVAG